MSSKGRKNPFSLGVLILRNIILYQKDDSSFHHHKKHPSSERGAGLPTPSALHVCVSIRAVSGLGK